MKFPIFAIMVFSVLFLTVLPVSALYTCNHTPVTQYFSGNSPWTLTGNGINDSTAANALCVACGFTTSSSHLHFTAYDNTDSVVGSRTSGYGDWTGAPNTTMWAASVVYCQGGTRFVNPHNQQCYLNGTLWDMDAFHYRTGIPESECKVGTVPKIFVDFMMDFDTLTAPSTGIYSDTSTWSGSEPDNFNWTLANGTLFLDYSSSINDYITYSGYYTINHCASNPFASNCTSKSQYILDTQEKRMRVYVQDFYNNSIINAKTGLKSSTSKYLNMTCPTGTCTYYYDGDGIQLVIGAIYSLFAEKDGYYTEVASSVNFSQNNKLYTFTLTNESYLYDPKNMTTLGVDVKDSVTHKGINLSTLYLLDIDNLKDRRVICNNPWGLCSFNYVGSGADTEKLTVGHEFYLNASSVGYYEGSQNFTYDHDKQVQTLYLIPENPTNLEINVDIRFVTNETHIGGVDISLYDTVYKDFANQTCGDGSCSFYSSGTEYQHSLQIGRVYWLFTEKTGFYPNRVGFTLRNSPHNQTIRLGYIGEYSYKYFDNQTIPWATVPLPTLYSAYPTITGNISPDSTIGVVPTIELMQTLNVTLPWDRDNSVNHSTIQSKILENYPSATFWLNMNNVIMLWINSLIYGVLNVVFSPLLHIIAVSAYVLSLVNGLFGGYSSYTSLLTYTLVILIGNIPVKVLNVLTLFLSVDIINQIWHIQLHIKRYGG